jgi:nitrate/nitrite-specific signal transduction histidine kinase
MSTAGENHGAYARKISDGLRKYAQDLLEESSRLRTLAAVCQIERTRLAGESEALRRENEELRDRLRQAQTEAVTATEELLKTRRELASRELAQAQMEKQMQSVDLEGRRLADQFASLEEQNNNLTNLYVASYRLHGTLDRNEVLEALQEILANLVGSEETALFERAEDGPYLSLVTSTGIEADGLRRVSFGRGLIGHVAQTGQRFLVGQLEPTERAAEEQHLSACIPLILDGRVVGAIAVFRLLPQKSGLRDLDQEIFDLLGSHAATALYCTALHARAQQGSAP